MNGATEGLALLVIADDLTGANDVGVQFAKLGISSVVLAQPDAAELPRGYEVVVVNTESRHVAPALAAERVRNAARQGVAAGVRNFFKKTDSTLRGNIGAELEALLQAIGENALAFVPAFPEMGRTTRGGIHYVDGTPIAETAFNRDPLSPVHDSNVADVLRRTSTLEIQNARLVSSIDWKHGCIVLDCESRNEMKQIAQSLAGAGRLRVAAGSAAFAEELPNVLPLRREPAEKLKVGMPILLVNGSVNPLAFEQIASASDEFARIQMPPETLFCEDPAPKFAQEVGIPVGKNVLLFTVKDRGDYEAFQQKAQDLGVAPGEIHARVSNATGTIVEKRIKNQPIGTLVVFGGDTLMGIARACGWSAFVPRTEVSAGITVATPIGCGLTVISKAGGFGDAHVVEEITDWIRKNAGETDN